MDISEEIGRRIAEKRKEKGWTQKELADKLNVSDKNVSKWECGRSVPDVFYLKQLSDLFGESIEYFIGGGDAKNITDVCREKRTRAGKISFTILIVLALFPLIVSVIARIFLPSTVPCHFDAHWEVTRWGSSRELISSGVSFSFIIITAAIALYVGLVKINNPEVKQWTVWLAFGVFMCMAVAMTAIEIDIVRRCYDLSLAAGYESGEHSRFNELFSVIISVVYAVCGALCIFIPMNGFVGVRIPYSYSGKEEWAFVNAFTGSVLYAVSVCMILLTGLIDYPANFGYTCAALFVPCVFAIAVSFASAALHKKIKADKNKEK